MCWISRLRFKKNGTALCPADITHLPVGHQSRPGLKDQRPRAKTVRRRIFTTTRLRRQDPPQVYHPPPGCCLLADCLAAGKNQTVRRARPLALRRAITFRPFLVLMRFRNPCSRLRLRFEGCLKVNDIAHSLSRDHSSMKRPHYRGGTGGCQSTCLLQSALQGRTEGEPELEWGKVSDRALATQPRTLEALLPDCDKHATETGRGLVLPHRSKQLFCKDNRSSPQQSPPWHPACVN